MDHLWGTQERHGEGDARGTDTQQRPRARGQEAGVVLTHARAWGRVLGQLGQPQGGRGAGWVETGARDILREVRSGPPCPGKGQGAVLEGGIWREPWLRAALPGPPSTQRAPEKVQQPPCLPRKLGAHGGGAPLQPGRKGQATAGEGTAEWTVQRRWPGRGGTCSRHVGLGSGLGRPAQPSQAAARYGARRASLGVPGPGLPPHLGYSR